MTEVTDSVLIIEAYEDDPGLRAYNDDIAWQHYDAFKNNSCSGTYEIYLLVPPYSTLTSYPDYRGEPTRANIAQIIQNDMLNKNKIIYIDDHSNWIYGDAGFTFNDHSQMYYLMFGDLLSFLGNSGTGTQEIIVRGNNSGKALVMCGVPKIYASMRNDQTMEPETDWYNLAPYIKQCVPLVTAHGYEYTRLWTILHRQEPVKCPD